MWKNHLTLAWRHLKKKPPLSVFKILGLGLGISASLLLLKYISWQWNFDRFHENYHEIVRVQTDHYKEGTLMTRSAKTYSGIPAISKNSFPSIKNYVRLAPWIANDVVFRHNENLYRGSDFFFVDHTFFDVFSFELIDGDPKSALTAPNSVVLTSSLAKSLFGAQNPMGKEIYFENKKLFKVTGIVKDPPLQSHIQFDLLASYTTLTNWGFDVHSDENLSSAYVYAYLQLNKSVPLNTLEKNITERIKSLKPRDQGSDVIHLQPLKDIQLYSDLDHELGPTGEGASMKILMSVAVLILILGWVNHFNLFSARAIEQIQSMGLRKMMGARRKDLFNQLFATTLIYSVLGVIVGLVLTIAIAPILASVFEIPFHQSSNFFTDFDDPSFYLMLFLILGTALSAILPAILLSNITTAKLSLNNFSLNMGGLPLRKLLVTFQLGIIIGLISCTIIISQQSIHMQEKPMGVTLENVLSVRAPLGTGYENLKKAFPEFKRSILAIPDVQYMGASKSIPGNQLETLNQVKLEGQEIAYTFYRNYGSFDYFDLYQIPFVARDTAINLAIEDKSYVIINEMALALLGFNNAQEILTKKIEYFGRNYEVVGVVKNHFQRSLHHSQIPIIYNVQADEILEDGYFSFKLLDLNNKLIETKIRSAYTSTFPYSVYDSMNGSSFYDAQYKSDNRFKKLNIGLTILALIIASMGLFGLILTTIEKAKKEMAIRKILGASLYELLLHLSKNYLLMALIAWMLACPIAFYYMNKWLLKFASQIQINILPFGFAGLSVFAIVIFVIGLQSHKIASLNPADNLRLD